MDPGSPCVARDDGAMVLTGIATRRLRHLPKREALQLPAGGLGQGLTKSMARGYL